MITKPDFSDFYRFLSSLGIIFVSLAFVMPWLFLRETFDSRITSTELSELTSDAQALIALRQKYALILVQNIGWISIIVGILGLLLLFTGIILWFSKKQTIIDEKDLLELTKLRHEVLELSPREIAEKAIRESSESPIDISEKLEVSNQWQTVKQYFELEETVVRKLQYCFGDGSLLTNRRIGRNEYDAILLARGNRLRDVIIEIKSIPALSYSPQRIRKSVEKISDSLATYVSETHQKSIGVGLFIISSLDKVNDEQIKQKYLQLAADISKQTEGVVVRAMTKRELEEMKCDEFSALIDFDFA